MGFTLNFARFGAKVGQNHRFLRIFEGKIPLLIALLVWDHQAAGSIPVTRTKKPLESADSRVFYFNLSKAGVNIWILKNYLF